MSPYPRCERTLLLYLLTNQLPDPNEPRGLDFDPQEQPNSYPDFLFVTLSLPRVSRELAVEGSGKTHVHVRLENPMACQPGFLCCRIHLGCTFMSESSHFSSPPPPQSNHMPISNLWLHLSAVQGPQHKRKEVAEGGTRPHWQFLLRPIDSHCLPWKGNDLNAFPTVCMNLQSI